MYCKTKVNYDNENRVEIIGPHHHSSFFPKPHLLFDLVSLLISCRTPVWHASFIILQLLLSQCRFPGDTQPQKQAVLCGAYCLIPSDYYASESNTEQMILTEDLLVFHFWGLRPDIFDCKLVSAETKWKHSSFDCFCWTGICAPFCII